MACAQLKQDITVLEHFKYKRGGFFVDIGCHDGFSLSNTYLLEKSYGWQGLAIDGNPDLIPVAKANRQCKVLHYAVSHLTEADVDYVIGDDISMIGGIVKNINYHQKTLNESKYQIVKQPTVTLTSILDQENTPNYIDYLSIDALGSGLKILYGIDFSRYRFGFITIEHNWIEPYRGDIKVLLESQGYVFYRAEQWDDFYIWPNVAQ